MTRWTATMAGLLMCLAGAPVLGEEPNYYDLLTTDRVGAAEFIRKHPEWDGRGVVVAVLDTGVDMSVEGLLKTSTGTVKVVEARDFSGQGIVHLKKPSVANENGENVLKTGDGVVRGQDKLDPKPAPDSFLLGFLEEERFRNSSVSDVNGNGTENDQFAILAGKVGTGKDEKWVAWIDTDADGQVDDEAVQEDYSTSRRHFFFQAQADRNGRKTMAIAMQIEPKRSEVSLHFPDGSHGTHVAGIATGCRLFGRDGFNGIAPGAEVMSLKIGDNTLSGGSTTTESMKKALEFAGSWSQARNIPVVVNMSYGIGSEKEGESDIDRITDQLVRKYPLLAVATSAGNSGPGLSTVGTPAGADLAFSTGALLTRENAASLYASRIARDVIFYFSSRGGELAKPDGLAPGCAAASVPPWEGWVIMRGTSMASPQAAGCLALLAGAAFSSKPALPVNGGLLKTALRNSGRPLEGVDLVDQGPGVVHVPSAWESLKKLAARKAGNQVAGFKVEGDCPTCPTGKARSAYFRAGTWLPKRPKAISFSISPLFMHTLTDDQRKAYFETVDLTVEGDWLSPTTDALFFNGSGSIGVDVMMQPEKLRKPGVHSAVIRATSRDSGKGAAGTLFELPVTVVVPYVFDLTQGFSKRFEREEVPPGEVKRYFFRVPEGAASMRVELKPSRGKFTQSRLTLFNPEGREIELEQSYADSERYSEVAALVSRDELGSGVWEAVVMTHYSTKATSVYDLAATFTGFDYEAPSEFYCELGNPPRGTFELKTRFDLPFEGRGRGGLTGLYRRQELTAQNDRISVPVTLEKDTSVLKLKLRMDRETYARFTDAAINVLDSRSEAVVKGGFSTLVTTIEIENPNVGRSAITYTLEIIGAQAERKDEPWTVAVEEYHYAAQSNEAKVWCDGYSYFTLYPNRSYTCEFELDRRPEVAPSGYTYFGELRFRDESNRQDALVMPLKLQVSP